MKDLRAAAHSNPGLEVVEDGAAHVEGSAPSIADENDERGVKKTGGNNPGEEVKALLQSRY